MIRLALLLSAVLLAVLPAPAQVVPEAGSMAATERYLFVRRGDEIFQLEIHSLRILKRVRLPAAEPVVEPEPVIEEPGPDPGGVEGGIEVDPKEPEEVVPDEAVLEPLEIEDEGPERQAGAGGKYGGRAKGGEELARRGGKASATAIQLGIDWLVRHQAVDGRWDADAFMERELAGERSDGPGLAVHDVGVTGLALLALLGDGNSLRSGPQRESVRRAVAWLREQQDPATGLIGTTSHHSFIYDHAIATLAMVEAYGLSEYKLLKSSAQRAIDYLEFHRNPYAVWRYQPRDGDNDTSVTAWCVMAYRSAQDFGLEVNRQAFSIATVWFEQMTDPASGRTGYTERGGFSSRQAGQHALLYPREASEAMTAAGLFCRFLLGQEPAKQPIMSTQADLVIRRPPVWEEGKIDEYAWFLGSLAIYQIGGRHWQEWSRHIEAAVVKPQRQDGNFAGSWDPIGVWGEVGGRVFSTAMLTLTLQSYYRYTRLVR